MGRKFEIIWLLIILSLLGVNLLSLEWAPPVGIDDTLFSAGAHNFVKKGKLAQTMNRTVVGFGENEMITGRILLAGLTVTGQFWGPSIWADRFWSWCMSVFSLWILWKLSKFSVGNFWGGITVVLCLVEPMFFAWSHIPRPEMTMAAIFLLAIYCAVRAFKERSKSWFFAAGLFGTLAMDVHLPGVILAPSIALVWILRERRRLPIRAYLFWFLMGAVLGLGWLISLHIFVNPKLFFLQWDFYANFYNIIKKPGGPFLAQFPMEYYRYESWFWGSGFQRLRLLEGALIVFGIFFQLRSKHPCRRNLSLATLMLILTMALMVNRKVVYYLVPLYPLFVLHASAGLRALFIIGRWAGLRKKSHITSKYWKKAGMVGLVLLFVFYTSQDVMKLNKYKNTNYARYLEEIQVVIPAGHVVAGSPSLWYQLGERNNLLSVVALLWAYDYDKYRGTLAASIEDLMHREKVEYIIVDPYGRLLLDSKGKESGRLLKVFLRAKCNLIKSFRNEDYIGVGECTEGGITEIFSVEKKDKSAERPGLIFGDQSGN